MQAQKKFSKKHLFWIVPLLFVVLAVSLGWVWPETLPPSQAEALLQTARQKDVVIIFNPGGWGNATLEQADDFTPILYGIQETLDRLGYSSDIVVYHRTPSGFSGTLSGAKEFIHDFDKCAGEQARDVAELLSAYPAKPVVIAGFSNGGSLSGQVYNLSSEYPQVYAIAVGVPFWHPVYPSGGSLVLDNSGLDPLAAGKIIEIGVNVVKAPFRYIWGKIHGPAIPFGRSYSFPGHKYPWSSPEVSGPISRFLERHLGLP